MPSPWSVSVTFLEYQCIHQPGSSTKLGVQSFYCVGMIDCIIGNVGELNFQSPPLLTWGWLSPSPLIIWLIFLVISPQSEPSHFLA